ncbi:MAG: hypothetical protein JSU66_14830 [Deltaproteobacteria bacterium]|nr:MAG: hypothetical protein JSU66_14830 [Deltaproteobacteria bacterium]
MTLRSLRQILNLEALFVTALAVAATHLCLRFEVEAELPLTLIATAVIFPIVFSIGGAYKRRESALDAYGSMKAHSRVLYFAARDWIEEPDPLLLKQVRERLLGLFVVVRELFQSPRDEMEEREARVYAAFAQLSVTVRSYRGAGLATGEVSRCNQYLSKVLVAFETMKHIYQYRTPRTLRAYSKLFIFLLPVVYGPYFAAVARQYTHGLEYLMPILFTAILVSLDNIQDHLENPFDQVGADDIAINAEKFVERLDS